MFVDVYLYVFFCWLEFVLVNYMLWWFLCIFVVRIVGVIINELNVVISFSENMVLFIVIIRR